MARIPKAAKELVPQSLHAAFDEAVAGEMKKRGGIPQEGNWTTMLYSPEACHRMHHWADYLRDHSSVPDRIQQLAMLVVAREFDCQYIWAMHAALGRKAGLTAGLVEALRDKKPLPALKPEEAAVISYGQEFYRTKQVSQETFDRALKLFGNQTLVELTMLMGFYAALAFNVNSFEIDVPARITEPPLPV